MEDRDEGRQKQMCRVETARYTDYGSAHGHAAGRFAEVMRWGSGPAAVTSVERYVATSGSMTSDLGKVRVRHRSDRMFDVVTWRTADWVPAPELTTAAAAPPEEPKRRRLRKKDRKLLATVAGQ